MNYIETITSKLEALLSDLSTLYDDILQNDYKGDITKVTKSNTKEDEFFIQIGKDIDEVRLMCDKILEGGTIYRDDLLKVNEMYKKYKNYF